MDKHPFGYTIALLLSLSWLTLGCGKASDGEMPVWKSQSLNAGPDIRVRINKQHYFNDAIFEWPANQVVLLDENKQVIERPANNKRIYIMKVDQTIKVAFKPGKAAFRSAKGYKSLTLQANDDKINHFHLTIPQIGLKRVYEAKAFHVSIIVNRLAIINQLPMEMYIARVIPAEMDPDHFTIEALKSQAVVARTWATRNRRRHLRYGYNFCDGPHCQVYKGRKLISLRAENATKMTAGEVIAKNGKVVDAFYHSTCGGNTVYVQDVWNSQPQEHLSRVEDRWKSTHRPYCSRSPYYHWTVIVPYYRLEKILRKSQILKEKEKLSEAKVCFVDRSGRVLKVCLVTDEGEKVIDGYVFRQNINKFFEKRKIMSNLYHIKTEGKRIRIVGHGLGHGVGLCQWGSRGMAQHGFDYHGILKHYFKGTTTKRLYGLIKESGDGLTQNSRTVK